MSASSSSSSSPSAPHVEAQPVQDFTSVISTGPHSTIQVCGNQLELHDSQLKTSTFITSLGGVDWSGARRIAAIAFHAPKQLLAVSVEGDDSVTTNVFRFQDQELVCTLGNSNNDGQELLEESSSASSSPISSLSFSHDGSLLYGVSGIDNKNLLHCWHIPTGDPVVWRGEIHRPAFPARVTHCTADPFNMHRVVAYGDAGIYICTLEKQSLYYTAAVVEGTLVQANDSGEGSASDHGDSNEPQLLLDTGLQNGKSAYSVRCTSWASGALFIATGDGSVLALNVASGQATKLRLEDPAGDATSILCIVDYLVVGSSNGTVQWFAKDDNTLVHTVQLPGNEGPVTNLTPLPSYQAVLACQAHVQITHVPLSVDEEAGPMPQPEVVRSSDAHTIEAVFPLDSNFFIGLADTSMLLYNSARHQFTTIHEAKEGCTLTTCALVPELSAVAVGTNHGELLLLSIDVEAAAAKVLCSVGLHAGEVCHISASAALLAITFADAVVVCDISPEHSPAIAAYSLRSSVVPTPLSGATFVSAVAVASADVLLVTDSEGNLFRAALSSSQLPRPTVLSPGTEIAQGILGGAKNSIKLAVLGSDVIIATSAASSRVLRLDVNGQAAHECLDAGASVMDVSLAGGHCTIGGADGSLTVWNLHVHRKKKKGKPPKPAKLSWTTRRFMTVKAAAADPTGTRLLAVGQDGLAVLYNRGGDDGKEKAGTDHHHHHHNVVWPSSPADYANGDHGDGLESLLEMTLQQDRDVQQARIQSSQTKLLTQAQAIKDQAVALVDANRSAPELERMEHTEFCINTAGRDEQLAMNNTRSAKLRREMLDQNLKKEILARRMKKLVWDQMEVPGRELHAFQSGVVVMNFPIPKFSPAEQARLDHTVTLRKMELREIRFGSAASSKKGQLAAIAWPGRLDELPDDVAYIANANLTAVQMKAGVLSGGSADNEGGDAEHEDDDDGEDLRAHEGELEELAFLLYHPCSLRTNRQRRAQVELVRLYTLELMRKFNDVFEALGAKKSDALEQISSKNKRIHEIVKELEGHEAVAGEQFFEPVHHSMEHPKSIFTVRDEEIPVDRYISPEEQLRLDEEEEQRRLAAEEVTDNPTERALIDMMNGQLESKQDGVASLEMVEKEAWMDQIPREKMSEEQLEAVAAYEASLAEFEQKKAEYEKALIQELRKLKTEVAEVVRIFDDQVKTAFKQRLQALSQVYTQQLYSFRLVHSINQQQACLKEERHLRLSLGKVQRQFSNNEGMIKRLTVEVTELKEQVDELKLADNALATSFKKTLQESTSQGLDHDTLKIYQQLFKVRRARRRSAFGSRSSRGSRTAGGSSTRSSLMNRSRGSRVVRKASAVSALSPSHASSRSGRDSEMRAAMAAAVKDTAAVLDPYRKLPTAALAEKAAADREEVLRPLTMDLDAPDGLKPDPELWKRLNELRTAKIESELQLKTMTKSMNESLAMVQAIEQETDQLSDQMNDIISQIEGQRDRSKRLAWDCDVVLKVTQGQDEVRGVEIPGAPSADNDNLRLGTAGTAMSTAMVHAAAAAAATEVNGTARGQEAQRTTNMVIANDYSDAMLVDRSEIESANKQVRKRGADKIEVLTKIKDFRKSINYMEWEHEYMQQKAINLEAHYTDLHMLRVTKSLQQFLQGSAGDHNKKQISKAEATLKFNEASFQTKSAKLSKSLRKMQSSIEGTKSECEKLEAQKMAVAKRVAQLESVGSNRSVVPSMGGPPTSTMAEKNAKAKMKAVVTRRKLIDLARAQTDEIEFLRKELDRLRQRTFPSFAHSRRAELQRLGNPDEHY